MIRRLRLSIRLERTEYMRKDERVHFIGPQEIEVLIVRDLLCC